MKRRRRRFNSVRDTRDPAVATAYERSAQASADWHLALLDALRDDRDTWLPASWLVPDKPQQYALPFEDVPPRPREAAAPAPRRNRAAS